MLWVHVFRYMVLYIFTARREGYPISDAATLELVIGDLAGATISLAAIILLRLRARLGLAVSRLLVLETIADLFGANYYRRIEPPRADATGAWWFVYVFFGPMILVNLFLLIWQLVVRRHEPLGNPRQRDPNPAHLTTNA